MMPPCQAITPNTQRSAVQIASQSAVHVALFKLPSRKRPRILQAGLASGGYFADCMCSICYCQDVMSETNRDPVIAVPSTQKSHLRLLPLKHLCPALLRQPHGTQLLRRKRRLHAPGLCLSRGRWAAVVRIATFTGLHLPQAECHVLHAAITVVRLPSSTTAAWPQVRRVAMTAGLSCGQQNNARHTQKRSKSMLHHPLQSSQECCREATTNKVPHLRYDGRSAHGALRLICAAGILPDARFLQLPWRGGSMVCRDSFLLCGQGGLLPPPPPPKTPPVPPNTPALWTIPCISICSASSVMQMGRRPTVHWHPRSTNSSGSTAGGTAHRCMQWKHGSFASATAGASPPPRSSTPFATAGPLPLTDAWSARTVASPAEAATNGSRQMGQSPSGRLSVVSNSIAVSQIWPNARSPRRDSASALRRCSSAAARTSPRPAAGCSLMSCLQAE